MSLENGHDLTKLGSGKHESVLGLPHTEMPVVNGVQENGVIKIGAEMPKNALIMQYFQERSSDSTPIVDTGAVNQETGLSYHEELVEWNTFNSVNER